MSGEGWIEVAARIGGRIVDTALWDGGACTWAVEAFDRATGGTRTEAAGAALYQGAGGIALFLGELAAATGDTAAARAAAGGIDHALSAAAELPVARYAFHTGRVGVAWAAARLAELLARPELRRRAGELLAPMAGHEHRDAGLDVIAGAAGAIPALLVLARELERPELVEMAARLGDHLIAVACRAPAGWSWGTVGPTAVGNLLGFAHGAAGVAVALLELARATGRGRYRFAAEMAFLYERRRFDHHEGNWPDLRHQELNRLFYGPGPEAVRAADAAGDLPPYRPHFMRAWCHGAPGAGLARLRAWELTGQPVYRREAEVALATTLPSLGPPPELGFSLCHGAAGNWELPLYAAELFDDPAPRQACAACADHGRRTYLEPGAHWPCGTAGGVPDPSLMLGEAGIGWAYLRLARPALPSVLLVRPPLAASAAEDDGYATLAGEWVEESFGVARAAFAALGVPPAEPVAEEAPLDRSPVEAAYEGLESAAAAAPAARRNVLRDALAVEAEGHRLGAEPRDLTEDYRRGLSRPAAEAVDWPRAALAPAPGVRLLTTERDWRGWRDDRRAGGAPPRPRRRPTAWLLARQGDRVVVRPVAPLTAAVLDAAAPPASVAEMAMRVAARLEDLAPEARGALEARVREQAEALYRAGLLEIAAAGGRRRAVG